MKPNKMQLTRPKKQCINQKGEIKSHTLFRYLLFLIKLYSLNVMYAVRSVVQSVQLSLTPQGIVGVY